MHSRGKPGSDRATRSLDDPEFTHPVGGAFPAGPDVSAVQVAELMPILLLLESGKCSPLNIRNFVFNRALRLWPPDYVVHFACGMQRSLALGRQADQGSILKLDYWRGLVAIYHRLREGDRAAGAGERAGTYTVRQLLLLKVREDVSPV